MEISFKNIKSELVKFDIHLAAYLYEHRSLQLEGIGTFALNEKVRVPSEQGKEIYYPIEGLEFIFDPKARTDENIIAYLVHKLHKIEPLIRSDLEYYLSNIKVLLNIGNPYTIEGIGTLTKNNQRVYEFTPGNFLPAKEELNPKRENADHNYPVRSRFSAARFLATLLIVTAALALMGGIGWGIVNFVKRQPVSGDEEQAQVKTDSIAGTKDTTSQEGRASSINNNVSPVSNTTNAATTKTNGVFNTADSVIYKMIFEITKSKERARARTTQLNNLHSYTQYDSIPIDDTTAYYRLFLIMKVSNTDTTHLKDSLRTFFGKRIFMERQRS